MFAKLFDYAKGDPPREAVSRLGTPEPSRPASLSEFASWLLAAGEVGRIPCAHLRVLYAEFAIFTETSPLSDGRFFRGLKAAGIRRKREGVGARRWYYQVHRPAASVAAVEARAAA